MIKTWIADISPLYLEENLKKIYETIPKFRKIKADNIKPKDKKAQSAGVWYLLQSIREKYNISDKAVFNLSHTGDYVVCAVDMDEKKDILLGVDGEVIHEVPLKLAERFYCKGEYEHILNKDEKDRLEEIIRIWVLKESFMKATRRGMAIGTDTFEFDLGENALLIRQPEEYKDKFYFREYDPKETGCRAAVCSTDNNICDHIDMEFLDLFKNI